MVNYQLGKIYKIVDNTNNNIYVGSTCEPNLARRLSNQIYDYKRREIRNSNMTSFQIFDNNNYDIILIENYPCERKDELHARERYYIESLKCVNKQFPGRTRKEYQKEYREVNKEYFRAKDHEYYLNNKESKTRYRNENKELIKQTHQKYYIKNKETLLEKSKKKVLCMCGKYREGHKTRHENSKFHQNYINNLCTNQP